MFSPPRASIAILIVLALNPGGYGDEKPLRSRIDHHLQVAWKRHKLISSGPADDATFLRRVTLDLVGTIPTHDEAVAFLADTSAGRRTKLIDRLLADPRHAKYQGQVWDLALFGRRPGASDATRNRDSFRAWLAGHFAKKTPYDVWVRELIRASQPGSEMFLVQFRGHPEDATEAVTRLFLGTQLQCARCHDHPYEEWTQRDFYGMAGFFVRLVVIDTGAKATPRYLIAEKSSGDVLFSGAAKGQRPGRRGEPVKPKFLGDKDTLVEPEMPKGFKEPDFAKLKKAPVPKFSRKDKFADWLTGKDNPRFARAVVNRVWGQYMGRGLIHPIDDMGPRSDRRQVALLDEMTKQFVAHQFDQQWLIKEIVSSGAYQLAAKGLSRDALPRHFERARVRPLSAEELLASVSTATGFEAAGGKISGVTREYFVMFFGEPTNGLGEFQGGLSEHLFFENGSPLRELIYRRKGNLVDRLITSKEQIDRRIDRLYLSILSRRPSPAERKKLTAYLTSEKKIDPLVEEAVWALLNTAEFRFNR